MLRTVVLTAAAWIALEVLAQKLLFDLVGPIDFDLWSQIAQAVRQVTQ